MIFGLLQQMQALGLRLAGHSFATRNRAERRQITLATNGDSEKIVSPKEKTRFRQTEKIGVVIMPEKRSDEKSIVKVDKIVKWKRIEQG